MTLALMLIINQIIAKSWMIKKKKVLYYLVKYFLFLDN